VKLRIETTMRPCRRPTDTVSRRADLLALLDVADRDAGTEQRRLERIGTAQRKGDQVLTPQGSDVGFFRHGGAVAKDPIARQVAAHVDAGTQRRQGGIAGLAACDQRTRLGIGRAERRELVRPIGRQDHQIGLKVAARHSGGHRGVATGSNLLAQEPRGTDRRQGRWCVHRRPPTRSGEPARSCRQDASRRQSVMKRAQLPVEA
jgi:hypothetical protein